MAVGHMNKEAVAEDQEEVAEVAEEREEQPESQN
jgi:hypothetical protein